VPFECRTIRQAVIRGVIGVILLLAYDTKFVAGCVEEGGDCGEGDVASFTDVTEDAVIDASLTADGHDVAGVVTFEEAHHLDDDGVPGSGDVEMLATEGSATDVAELLAAQLTDIL